jgi:signal transduction histidine kinase
MSHELRTPLNSASLGVKIILDGLEDMRAAGTAEASELLDTAQDIKNCIDCGVELVESLQNLDKLENDLLFLHSGDHHVIPFVEECVRPFVLEAEQRGINLRVHNGPVSIENNIREGTW